MRFLTTQDGHPSVIVDEPGPVSEFAEASTADLAVELFGEDLTRPFDLEPGPLLRAVLVRLAPDDHVLLLAAHHSVTDGWSTE